MEENIKTAKELFYILLNETNNLWNPVGIKNE